MVNSDFELCASTEILLEYNEIFASRFNVEITETVLHALYCTPTFIKVEVYFRWNLIYQDPDDNKFVDCFIAHNACYIVTNDKHFNNLKADNSFSIKIVNEDEFAEIFSHLKSKFL